MNRVRRAISWAFNGLLSPLCWFGWHPLRAKTGKSGRQFRCERCGRYVSPMGGA